MKEVKVYEPMMMVTLKNGRVLFFPASKLEGFKAQIKDKTIYHIDIEGVGVNKLSIETYEPIPDDLDILIPLSTELRNKMLNRIKYFEERLGRIPSKQEKQSMLNKIIDNEKNNG